MRGAEAILRTGEAANVEYCFTNPGSTEMDMLVAFDIVAGVQPVLCLHETVCTGMADGYGRITGRPAFTLLHQGAGFANGAANLHNARKAPSPIVNLVGGNALRDNDRSHLASDMLTLAKPVSDWYKTATSAASVATDTAEAIAAALRAPGHISTLIVPADAQSGDSPGAAKLPAIDVPRIADGRTIDRVAQTLRERKHEVALVLHSRALTARALAAAGQLAAATGCALLAESIPRRMERGAHLPAVQMVPCMMPPMALEMLGKYRTLVYVGAAPHEPYFLLADTPAPLVPPTSETIELGTASDDLEGTLEALADALGARSQPVITGAVQRPAVPSGALTPTMINTVVATLIPEGAIVVQTSTTGSRDFLPVTRNCPPYSILMNTGASIGWGMPAAAGAALAARDRRVIHMAADGGDILAVQALWTQAREQLDVVTIVFCNRVYKILQDAIAKWSPPPGPRAASMLTLEPTLDYCAIAKGFGVPATRATTGEELHRALEGALRDRGPHLIEAII